MSDEKENNICPQCGHVLGEDETNFCSECGASITKNNEVETHTKEELKDYQICPKCNNHCSLEADFCNKCGSKIVIEYKCPKCGADYNKDDLFCIKCGEKLQEPPKELHCYSCGAKYTEGDTFCGECGAKLLIVEQENKPIATNNDSQVTHQNTETKTDASESYNYNTVKCPYCNSKIPRYTKKCPHCGEWLSGVSHFGCGSFMMLITTILAIFMAVGGESLSLPLVGELGGIVLVIIAFLYFLPSLIADWRGHDSKLAIFIVNLLFGWTLLGWFIALIFSFTGRSR